ncbi:FMN-binding glutamate synthase family protein [Candidatus Poribacteria bacterium]|nr:FMN-binding glutamate synthase family protein [Candidatus Poribacteria bacterium]MBT5532381.1 FMN-binding glutamate synthase family protein [Candidatus Poribacteria bacterium]MBT5713814.1 FMN-binding glutamate synthase family protein [Candidatus Poribacteria bacterium]MBT7097249.1 FMN-binding glutamate synthase family protein [Candidatus Poribacteria bacterium]
MIAVGALGAVVTYLVFASLRIQHSLRPTFYVVSAGAVLVIGALGYLVHKWCLWGYVVVVPLVALGVADITQKRHTIRRNFPVIGNFRYLLEMVRPEIRQYFIESDSDEAPYSREKRSTVYQRSKDELDTIPFGTKRPVYRVGYEWITHSMAATAAPDETPRVTVGGPDCSQPYSAALLNVSAMSFGALSRNAILALNRGAKLGSFYHNTGEGGVSPHHLEHGGDLVWQVGTGYFGCRTDDGVFCPDRFRDRASTPTVKMIEIKLSQGAKPGHGGILPGAKVTPDIAAIRGVPLGRDVISPPAHTAFSNPVGLMEFVGRLRELSDGKPIGFKLCVGHRRELLSLFKAMLDTGIYPDFVTVDGAEGGTGAAPVEFSNSVGMPMVDGLLLVRNGLVGIGAKDRVRIIAAGRISTGYHIARLLALGADLCNSARAMMFALGCIQALKCNTNHCPVGVATQDASLYRALDPSDKAERVASYQAATIESLMELLGAAGLAYAEQLTPWHIARRVSATDIKTFAELYDLVEPGSLLSEPYPDSLDRHWRRADASSFLPPERVAL